MKATPPSDAVIAQYLTGDCSEGQRREIEAWMALDPAHRARVESLRVIWGAGMVPVPRNVDAMWLTVQRRISARAATRRRFPLASMRLPLAAAATLVIVVGGGALFLHTFHRTDGAVAEAPSMREYATARGERATVRLSDGSEVALAAESRLRIPSTFGAATRELYLDGEAIFNVVHDGRHPFRVHARGALVEDLGTKFDLRAYAEDAMVSVIVAEGSVTLGQASTGAVAVPVNHRMEGIVLRGGDLGDLDGSGHVTTKRDVRVASYLGWANGQLVFTNEALPDVLRTIGRWYDLDLRVPDARLAARRVTAEFSTQSPSAMLDALALALDARVVRNGRTATFVPQSASEP